jgi:hypothetical protein
VPVHPDQPADLPFYMKLRQKKKSALLNGYKKRITVYNSEASQVQPHPELLAAHDFRAQQQLRYAQVDGKTELEEIRHRFPEAMQHLREVFPDAEINFDMSLLDAISLVTENDKPLSHSLVQDAKDLVEGAARALGLRLFNGVSAGAIDSPGLEASQQRLMLTDASVVLVSEHMLLALHRFSKLLALSVPFTELDDKNFKISEHVADYTDKLDIDSQLQNAWCEFLINYSLHPTNPPRGSVVLVPSNQRMTLMSDLNEAMLCFVVAHEYGHHIAAHSLGKVAGVDGPDKGIQHKQEIEADSIGALLTMELGKTRRNHFAMTNVGSVLVLNVLELFRRGSAIISSGNEPIKSVRETHPLLQSFAFRRSLRGCWITFGLTVGRTWKFCIGRGIDLKYPNTLAGCLFRDTLINFTRQFH